MKNGRYGGRVAWAVLWASLATGANVSAQTATAPAAGGKPAGTQGTVPQGLDTPGVKVPVEAPQPGSETLDTPGVGEARDASGQASPVPAGHAQRALPPGVKIEVQLNQAVSSGAQKNGELVAGVLTVPLRTSTGAVLAKGTPVQATVVSAARAGTMNSGGVLTLQLTRIGSMGIVTDVREFDGREGHKDVADSAPAKGEEANVAAGTKMSFELMENGSATGLFPLAPGTQEATVGSGGGNQSGGQQSTGTSGSPSTAPGVNQRPTGGATQGVTPRPPSD